MSAWGRTGRVTLAGEVLPWVRVDEVPVGWVYTPDEDYAGWGPRTLCAYYAEHLPSLDAAVLWVLRRVDPGLWREERGEVVAVRRAGAFSATPWAWAVVHGEHGPVAFRSTWGEAMSRATEAVSA